MNFSSECSKPVRCRELDLSSSFCRSVYSEIEDVGWEHLVKLDQDFMFLSFRILDKKGRAHVIQIELEKAYPRSPPSISADVPYTFHLKWSVNSRLKHVVQQFQEHLERLQEFWRILDNIDKSLWVVYPKEPSRATSCREIKLGNDCSIVLSVNVNDPRSLPECRFMGSDPIVNSLRKKWRRNSKRWINLSLKILLLHWRHHCQDPQMFRRTISKLNVESVMLNFFLLMKSLVLRVEAERTTFVRIPAAVGPSIEFVLGIGCVPLQQQGSLLMFCLGIVLTVQIPLQSKLVTIGNKSWLISSLSDNSVA